MYQCFRLESNQASANNQKSRLQGRLPFSGFRLPDFPAYMEAPLLRDP